MKISGKKLTEAMQKAATSPEQLADSIADKGFKADAAASAIRNWMRGNDHPRCKAVHAAKMAEALGVFPKDICTFQSQVRGHRGSPRKAKLVTDLIRGKSVDQALNLLGFTPKRAAVNIKKALTAAIADAQQADADETTLYVCDSRVDAGTRMKRFQPKDRGRAHPITKMFSHITVAVEERTKKG